MSRPVVIYGSAGYALAIREHIFRFCADLEPRVVAYIDDFRGEDAIEIDGAPVITFERWRQEFLEVPVIVTIGDPAARRLLAARIEAAGGSFASFIADRPGIAGDICHGEGSIISAMAYIGTNVVIGRHVHIQPMVSLGHDDVIGDFSTICGCSIAGWVVVEEDVFVGIGAVIVNGTQARPIRIGRGAVICAGAVITKSVAAGARMIGNPAQDLRRFAATRRRGPAG